MRTTTLRARCRARRLRCLLRASLQLAVLASASLLVASGCTPRKTTLTTGEYRDDQWARGVWLYGQHCARCHDLFHYIQTQMPPLEAGTLNDEDTFAIVAYVLKQAEYELPEGDLDEQTVAKVSLDANRPADAPSESH